ncbi:MAG: aminotransferase class I/II-fold pyridoxal phosphate-dependent enzyme [Thermoanaerobaculia bacterium]|nr:aminotransferase class I/II-fold pyridoxal phosphate-dependent enzyme [Thermoanaerobaculia bacterium]
MFDLAAPASRRTFARLFGAGAAYAALAPLAGRALAAAPAAPVAPPHDAGDGVRLSANENPYGPSPAALAAIAAALPAAGRYPDRTEDALVAALAEHHGVAPAAIALGAGSSQILHAAANAFTGPAAGAVVAEPTFEAFGHYAGRRGARVTRVALTAEFHHDLDAMARAAGRGGVVYLCNPNNPTATLTPIDAVRALLERLPAAVTVLVDEAYHGYAEGEPGYASVVPWIARHPNLLVARTFSKIYGLAGLRCGYALGAPAAIAALRDQLPWDGSNVAALVAARAALGDDAFVHRSRAANVETRAAAVAAMTAAGARVLPSAANFVMADLGADVAPVIAALRADGVRVGRRFAALPHHLRVTVGTADEMRVFAAAFERARRAARAA